MEEKATVNQRFGIEQYFLHHVTSELVTTDHMLNALI